MDTSTLTFRTMTSLTPTLSSFYYHYLWVRWKKDKSLWKMLWWYVRDLEEDIGLHQFIDIFSEKQSRYMTLILEGDIVAGCFVIDSIQLPHRLCVGVWLDFAYRGRDSDGHVMSDQIAALALEHIHAALKPVHIFAYTPWRDARALCERVGMPVVATIAHGCHLTRDQVVWVCRKDYNA